MKKFVLFFFLITYSAIAYNQVIKGIILDEKTKSAIEFATVYFNGTFVGTSSDKDGKFELDISKNTSMPLTISSIGYYSVALADFSTQNPVVVYLTSKEYEVNEVVVKGIPLKSKRKAYLKSFKCEFLGRTSNARKCVIMNENDITFNYGSDKDTVKAFASKPILIDTRPPIFKTTRYHHIVTLLTTTFTRLTN